MKTNGLKTINRALIAIAVAALCSTANVQAQDSDFDLSSQRSEKQEVDPVDGQRIDHNGLVINPTPQSIKVAPENRLDASQGFSLADAQKRFGAQIGALASSGIKLNAKGVKLSIDFGAKIAKKAGVKELSGAYSLVIDKKGVTITGYDERGAFYGLQTLRQVVESPIAEGAKLPYLTVDDYPTLPDRGVVEGFYGTPWSHEVRLSLIDFYGRFKLCTYLYGPKDDPYHSSPNWRLPYPEAEAKQIRELVEACNRNYVDFVWAIHPGKDIKWNEEDYGNLLRKLNMMYDLGVRSFALFFDDISGEGTKPVKQVELLNRLHSEFVEAHGDVAPLTMCPTDYSRLWANPSPDGPLAIYGNTLNPSIKVFWTGDVVCSNLTKETLDWVNSRIKRPAYYWWNFPVTDYARHIIMQGPTYGLEKTLTASDLCGLVSNPMEHGEASKLALYGVADYCWNIAAYNPLDNWERGLAVLTPEAREAYRTFAIHSCDTETGYRRDESWETTTFSLDNYTEAQYDALYKEFAKIQNVEATMRKHCTNRLLLRELSPWLTEFTKLGKRGTATLELIKTFGKTDNATFWQSYTANLMNDDDCRDFAAHKCGTMKLQPFYENNMDALRDRFFKAVTSQHPSSVRCIGSFATLNTPLSKLMLDNDATTYYHSGLSQSKQGGDWIGLDLGVVKDVREVNIVQGRNSVDDVDYFDHATLEASADGRTWQPLIAEMEKQYDIHWQGEAVKARYVRLRKLPSEKVSWVAVRTFEVNPVTPDNVGIGFTAPNRDAAVMALDKNPGTCYKLRGTFDLDVAEGTTRCVIFAKEASLAVTQLNAKGNVVAQSSHTTPFIDLDVAKGTTTLRIAGTAEIFEIIQLQ